MAEQILFSLHPGLDQAAVLMRLDRVLDPELDESIISLGFVTSVTGQSGQLTVEIRLPTYWCAANFSYLMASDIRRQLLTLEGVQQVSVRVQDHFASGAIESGVAAGEPFASAFPDGGDESLEGIRDLFLRKGYLARQENLLRQLKNAGLSFPEIAALRMADVGVDGDSCWVVRERGHVAIPGAAAALRRYLERRAELEIDSADHAPLICQLGGGGVPAGELETYYVRARTSRLAMEANGSLCSALLKARGREIGSP